MNLKEQPIHIATIFQPKAIRDEQLRNTLVDSFGPLPVWMISISQDGYDLISQNSHAMALSLAVCPTPSGGSNVALVLQFDGLQIRSIVGRDNPFFLSLLANASQSGFMRLSIAADDGYPSDVISWPVKSSDMQRMMDTHVPVGDIALERRLVELGVTAANCRDHDDIASLFPDFAVIQVEVSVVTDGEATVAETGTSEHSERESVHGLAQDGGSKATHFH